MVSEIDINDFIAADQDERFAFFNDIFEKLTKEIEELQKS